MRIGRACALSDPALFHNRKRHVICVLSRRCPLFRDRQCKSGLSGRSAALPLLRWGRGNMPNHFLSERLSLFAQCICAFLPTAATLMLTAFLCGKLKPPMLLAILIGCAVLYAAIWGLRTWRWKCRVGEINLLLPEASRQRRTLWGAALGAFCSTVLLWSIAVLFGAAAMLLLML